jgi:ADP-ribose pyrophosphatase
VSAGPHDERWTGPVADSDVDRPLLGVVGRFDGAVWSVRSDTVDLDGQPVVRDVVAHPGAVGIIALDDDDRVLLLRQYRHPVGRFLFEPPAGLLDLAGEDPAVTARRELREEAGLEARDWHVLVDYLNSPGGTSETFRCYLARGLGVLPGGRERTGEAEERHLPQAWVGLDGARDLVLSGALQNPTAVLGVLAAWTSRAGGWRSLRPADARWPVRERVAELDARARHRSRA